MPARSPRVVTATSLLVLLVAGCGEEDQTADQDAPAATGTEVAVVDNDFEPGRLEVGAGETVTWTWEGRSPHDVDSDEFGSEVQTAGTFTHTFEEAGEHDYTCTLHSGMNGTIVVTGS